MYDRNYYVYILTNKNKTVLYTGVTNNLVIRLKQHIDKLNPGSFTSRYQCFYLVHFEKYKYINNAIAREKEIKGWTRAKKNALITDHNKNWTFLNDDILS